MKAASWKITFQLTPGQYRYAEKQAAAEGYPSAGLFSRSRVLEHPSTSIIPSGPLSGLSGREHATELQGLIDKFDDLLTVYEGLIHRADRWDEHFAANGLLPAAVFEEQCKAVRMIVRGINDQLTFGVGGANDQ